MSWISAGHGFPETPDDIVAHPNFHWPRHGLHFWHEFVRDGEARVAESFADTRAKFAHLFARYATLARMRRRIWVYSNTQNNLDVVRSVAPALDFRLDAKNIAAVAEAAGSQFDVGTDEFLFLCREDRVDPGASEAGLPLRILRTDDSEVMGDAAQWADAFRELIPARALAAAEPAAAAPVPAPPASVPFAPRMPVMASVPPPPPQSRPAGLFGFFRGQRA